MSFVLQVIRTDMAAPESIQSRLVHFHQFFGIISIIRKTGLEREREGERKWKSLTRSDQLICLILSCTEFESKSTRIQEHQNISNKTMWGDTVGPSTHLNNIQDGDTSK